MLPHNHFLVAALTVTPAAAAFCPERSVAGIGGWILAGGIAASAIDLDIIILVLLRSGRESRLKPFRDPRNIFKKYGSFMKVITRTGLLRTGAVTHVISSGIVILLSYFFLKAYFIPVSLGVISHLVTDIPHLRKLVRGHLWQKNNAT